MTTRDELIAALEAAMGPDDRQIAEWVVNTCLTFGAQMATAYKAAGLFLEGINK